MKAKNKNKNKNKWRYLFVWSCQKKNLSKMFLFQTCMDLLI
jgi:hypothetical protein